MNIETQENKDKYSEQAFTNQISTSAKEQIALQNTRLKQDTSRYQENADII
jgi:hypothetical protein